MKKIKILNLYGEALDLNGDGKVTSSDARKALRMAAGLE